VGPSISSFLFEPRLKAINLPAVNKLFLDKIGLFKQHTAKTTKIDIFQFSFS